MPTSFSPPLCYPHFLFLILINSWPPGRVALFLLPLPPLSARADTPVGRSRQSPVSLSLCTGVQGFPGCCCCHLILAPGQPLPTSTELPPQEIPPSPLGRAGTEKREPEPAMERLGEPPSDLEPRTKTSAPSPRTSKALPGPPFLPVGQKKGGPSPPQVTPLCLLHSSSFSVSPFDS